MWGAFRFGSGLKGLNMPRVWINCRNLKCLGASSHMRRNCRVLGSLLTAGPKGTLG